MSKEIEVNVPCDYLISKETYLKVLEVLLKYILYQCHQIPVQLEVLQRDNKNWKSNSQSESVYSKKSKDDNNITSSFSCSMNARQEIKERACQRRKEQMIRSYEKKRKTWLLKVDNFLNCYNDLITMLQEELDNNILSSVLFIIGNSPSLANVVFKVYVNSNLSTSFSTYHIKKRNSSTCFANNSHNESLERKFFLGLFRAFAANEELTTYINGHFATTKLWLLLHKQPRRSDIKNEKQTTEITCDFIPQMDFKIAKRAKLINIVLNELPSYCNNEIVDMELTPCIDSKLMHTSNTSSVHVNNFGDRKRIKVSLFPSVCNGFNKISSSKTNCGDKKLDFQNALDNKPEFGTMSENRGKSAKQNNKIQVMDSVGLRLENHNLIRIQSQNNMDDIDKMPISIVETSPIKVLSKNVDSLHFSETYSQLDGFVWYQYPKCIKGFKDLYLHNNSL